MRYQLEFNQENQESRSLTQQQFKKDTDINNIVKKYRKTGVVDALNKKQPHFGDYSDLPEFQTLQNTITAVNGAFSRLPAETRNQFNNNPQEALDFLADPKNKEQAEKLGLTKVQTPAAVEPEIKSTGATASSGNINVPGKKVETQLELPSQ